MSTISGLKILGFENWNIQSLQFFCNLYNKTRHSYIHVAYCRLNGWTDWAEIFLWTLMGGRWIL